LEIAAKENIAVDENIKADMDKHIQTHKEKSRSLSAGVFKGGLADHSPEVVRLHTATHLLLASLRKVLGEHIVQKGQNITKERARFDFSNSEKLEESQLKKVENMINEVVQKDLPVGFKVLPKNEAERTGAIHAFGEKYADTVKVYYVGEDLKTAFSKEFCGGPHVGRTGEIGRVRIIKQDKIGSNLIRIYAVFQNGRS
jgi:alanyl-tRNA synthetase